MYSKQSHSAIRTTLDLKTTNTYVTVTGVSSRITVTLSYLKQKKKEKNTNEYFFGCAKHVFCT